MKKVFLAIALMVAVSSVYAHGGRTDASGCHKESKTGTVHCH